tara:strand:- start:122 stop:325 length:204 start_codon:yes stop_codon:yes gene_type:complete
VRKRIEILAVPSPLGVIYRPKRKTDKRAVKLARRLNWIAGGENGKDPGRYDKDRGGIATVLPRETLF